MTEEMDRVQALQEEVNALREELAAMKAEKAAHAPVEPTASLEVIESIEKSTADQDLQVETYCRWAAARAGAIVIAPLVGTIALMANEVYLVSRIARVYNVKLSERAVIAFLGAMGRQHPDDAHSLQCRSGTGSRSHYVQLRPRDTALDERRHADRHGSVHRHDGRMERQSPRSGR